MGLLIENVSHAFGDRPVLHAVGVRAAPGELVCLLGPSGCGKTTLLRLAAGLETLQAGRIAIDGVEVAGPGLHVPPERRGVGMVFQDFALFPHLSVLDNVAFGLLDRTPAARRERALAMLDTIGMADYAERFPHVLSGGQQQRVALARALAPSPRLVLLDEPFSGLDARLRERLRDDALHVLKTSQVMALMVTHDAEEAMFMADRVAVMRDGRVVQYDRPNELYFHPTDAFVADFFGEINRMEGRVAQGQVATALGPVPAEGFADGAVVEVLVRPEGLALAPPDEESALPQARVLAARMLGRTSLVHLALDAGAFGPLHLHARVPGTYLPAEGERVAVRLERRLAFVFEKSTPESDSPADAPARCPERPCG